MIGIPERKACHESSTVSAGLSSSIAPVTSSARTRTIDAQSYAIATEALPYSPLFEPKTETDSSADKISRRNPPCLAGAAESRTDDQGAVPLHAPGGGIHGEASRVDTLMSATGELEPRPRSHVHSIRGLASIAVRPNNFLKHHQQQQRDCYGQVSGCRSQAFLHPQAPLQGETRSQMLKPLSHL